MERQRAILILLFLAVVASGCTSGGGDQESTGSITVHQLSVSPQEIYEGTSVTVSLDLANTGNLPAEVDLGNDGQRVMKDYCPDIFEIEGDVSVTTSGERDGNRVELGPEDELRLRWRLQQKGDVPLYGQRCDLKFQVPFNYSVSTYKQVQIKRSREVEDSKLQAESSSGPLFFALETIGSSTENPSVFIAGKDDSVSLLMQLQNRGQEGYSKGVVDVEERSLSVRASEPLELDENFTKNGNSFRWEVNPGAGYSNSDRRCESGDEIRMFEGDSRVLKCDIPVPKSGDLSSPSAISEIFARIDYAYMKDAGSRQVEVKTRGN